MLFQRQEETVFGIHERGSRAVISLEQATTHNPWNDLTNTLTHRERALVVNLESVRMIIAKDEVSN